MANFPIQRNPNASSEEAITIAVVTACEAAAAWRAIVHPKSAAQNGTTSRKVCERPRPPRRPAPVRVEGWDRGHLAGDDRT
jgi:hypothetical protein